MKKLIILLALIGLAGCIESHPYNIKYRVTYNNGDQQVFNENLDFKPDEAYLDGERGETGCVVICAVCKPTACGVRSVETISITQIK